MRSPHLLLSLSMFAIASIGLVSAAVGSPAQSISQPSYNTSSSKPNLSNTESRFDLNGTYGKDELNILSVLMNTVDGLADLAHQPSDSRLRGFHFANLAQYTDIDMSIQPAAPAMDIEVIVVVWGLYYVVSDMIDTKTFRNADFDLRWDDVKVAKISITNRKRSAAQPRSPATAQNQDTLEHQTMIFNGSNLNGVDHIFRYVPPPLGKKLSFQEVFITIMATLKDLAQRPDHEVAKPFISGAAGVNARFELLETEPSPSSPPLLVYGWLIDIIRLVPAYMIQKKNFAELLILAGFDHESIGKALLEKSPRT